MLFFSLQLSLYLPNTKTTYGQMILFYTKNIELKERVVTFAHGCLWTGTWIPEMMLMIVYRENHLSHATFYQFICLTGLQS